MGLSIFGSPPRTIEVIAPESTNLDRIQIPRFLKNRYFPTVYTRHEYTKDSNTTPLTGSKTRLSALKAMIVPRVQLTDAVSISPRSTKQISSALEVSMPQATLWVNSPNIIFLDCPIAREKSSCSQTPSSGVMSIPSRILLNMAQNNLDVQI